ncbi:MAG TPA: hypothetical protein VMW10_07545 [Alphaproteobacteria bacterium]|nr:hypothetical protein [Alphaproteobacteria bacterium]
MNTLQKSLKNNMLPSQQAKALCLFALAFLLFTPEAFGVANTNDAGFTKSTTDLVSILDNSLVPITLISGCLAAAALSFMKSTPAPFVIAILTTISFGFAKVWINTTYAICV